MRGMTIKMVVMHHNDELKKPVIAIDEHPIARVTWDDGTNEYMRRIGGSVVKQHFDSLAENVRMGLEPTLEKLLQKVLKRFSDEAKADEKAGAKK